MTDDGVRRCEKCGATAKGFGLLDYCAECSAALCDDCMARGHCGKVPAESGTERDYGDDAPERPLPPSKRAR
jgi:hypothetical protein